MKVEIPECYATFEVGHPQCEGDPKGRDDGERAPCAFRDRCRGLQIHVSRQAGGKIDDEAIERVLGGLDDESLVSTADMVVDELDIVDGRLRSERPAAPVSTATKKRRRRPSRKAPYPDRLMELYQHGRRCFRDRFADWRFADKGQIIAGPGVIYEANRLATCDYVTFYCSSEGGPHHAMASFRFRPGSSVIDVELPVEAVTLEAAIPKKKFEKLDVRPLDRGLLRSVVKAVDDEATIGLIVETLRRFADDGRMAMGPSRG